MPSVGESTVGEKCSKVYLFWKSGVVFVLNVEMYFFVALRLHCFTSSNVGVSTAEDPSVDGCLWHCSSEKLVAKRSSQETVVDGWRRKQRDRILRYKLQDVTRTRMTRHLREVHFTRSSRL